MQLDISKKNLSEYIIRQINTFFPDGNDVLISDIASPMDKALDRLSFCFNEVISPRYQKEGQAFFHHLYADHYVMLLWFLSNSTWKETGNKDIASKLYYLNKVLHGLDCMYDTEMPDIFLVFHGVGTMLGKAKYADYFIALHGCTIGSHKGEYPIIDKGVALTAYSALIGNCEIGNRVSISAYTPVFGMKVANDNIVMRNNSGQIEITESKICYSQQFFKTDLSKL